MPGFDDITGLPSDFAGTVRLFPLPNLVLFPHVMQPLHVFEPRYRELFEAAQAGDRLMAMAVLAPGWEDHYEDRPLLYPFACLGRISTHCQLDDGTYNLLLLGLQRVRLLEELPPMRSYREAKVELCDEFCPPEGAAVRAEVQKRLRQAFLRVVPMLPEAQEQIDQLLGSDITLGVLSDVIGYMLDISVAEKHGLLAELNVVRRAERVLEHLDAVASDYCIGPAAGPFPPDFSEN